MSSPLPKAPPAPDLPDLPSNPLPRLNVGRPGGAPRLRLPNLGRLGGHRAPRPPIGGHHGPQHAPQAQQTPPARTVVNVQAAPPAAPSVPVRPHGARPSAAQEREGNRTFLGDRLGGSLNRLPRASRERMRTLLRDHGREYHHGYHEAGEQYLRERIEERRTQRRRERGGPDAPSPKKTSPAETRAILEGRLHVNPGMERAYEKIQPYAGPRPEPTDPPEAQP